jgi:hypothetical protein
MKRVGKIAVLQVMSLVVVSLALARPSPKAEKVTGEVVAYGDNLGCLNGNSYWWMLIQVQNLPTSSPAKFIRVQFSLPCEQSPDGFNEKSHTQKFRLEREQNADSVLDEFYKCVPESTGKCPSLPIWRRVPGAENVTLPFGQIVPSYRSLDLPLVPVL